MTDSTACRERDRLLTDLYGRADELINLDFIETEVFRDKIYALLRVAYSLGRLTRLGIGANG